MDNDEIIFIRNVPKDVKTKLTIMQKEAGYKSLNQFMLDKLMDITDNATFELYDTNFGKYLKDTNEKIEQIIRFINQNQKDTTKDRIMMMETKNKVEESLKVTEKLFELIVTDLDV